MRQIDGKEVRGTVTDEKGNPLPGVTVMLKGTSLGVITDVEGKYTLRLPWEFKELKLIFSFVGMKTQEMSYAGQTELNVTMHEEAAEMDEVVIIGYGSSKKKDLTGSVATVKTEELKNLPALTVDDAMAGKAAGVQVTKADGSPGGAVRIRIRGGYLHVSHLIGYTLKASLSCPGRQCLCKNFTAYVHIGCLSKLMHGGQQ